MATCVVGGGNCDDENACTRNDACSFNTCRGTSFSCLTCQTCDGSGCVTNSDSCVISNTCYLSGDRKSQARIGDDGCKANTIQICGLYLISSSCFSTGM